MKTPQQSLEFFHELTTTAIYLMGGSFILGSAFTILILVLLDWVRSSSHNDNEKDVE